MRGAKDPDQPARVSRWQSFCFTNLSTVTLVGSAMAVSVVLWLCIWAVI